MYQMGLILIWFTIVPRLAAGLDKLMESLAGAHARDQAVRFALIASGASDGAAALDKVGRPICHLRLCGH